MPGAPQRTSQPMTAIDHVPFWLVFLGSIALVLVPMDLGHRLGVRRRLHGGREREAATSVITAGLVSLNSFFLAFIFGMVQQGIVYAGWNPDWFKFFMGVMLLFAVIANNAFRNYAAKR